MSATTVITDHIQANRGRYVSYATELLHSRDDAEDAVQKASLRAWGKFDTFDPEKGSLRGWFEAILKNVCLGMLRNRHGKEESLDALPEHAQPGQAGIDGARLEYGFGSHGEEAVSSRLVSEADRGKLRQAIAWMPASERKLLEALLEENTCAAVAGQRGVSGDSVRMKAMRTRQNLRHLAMLQPSQMPS